MLLTRKLTSLKDFHRGIGAAGHATLDIKQHISYIRTVLVETIVSVQGSSGEVIPVSDLFTKIHDILDNALTVTLTGLWLMLSNKLHPQ